MKKIFTVLLLFAISQASAQIVQPEWSKTAVMYEVNLRQYSEEGSIKEFEKSLPKLKELGVNVLWLMPLHPIGEKNRKGGMGSYYSVQDYKEIDPSYGTTEDFKKFVSNAHSYGMKVIIDWVANHTAWDNPWLLEHPEWYVQNDKGEIVTQYDWTDVAKLNFNVPELRTAMTDVMRYWVNEFDIDGFRCDVAFLVPLDFWEENRTELEKIKPLYMLAEMEWNTDITPSPETYFINAFNAAYAWNFMGSSSDFVSGKVKLEKFKANMLENYSKFPAHMQKLFFLTNHDENSWNGTVDEKYGKNWQNVGVMVYTLPQSIPLIYTGEEVGLNRRLKFFEKDNITKLEWENKSRLDWYKRMTTLKHSVPALKNINSVSNWKEIKLSSAPENMNSIYAYTRENGGSELHVFMNFSSSPVTVKALNFNLTKLLTSYKVESNAKQSLTNGKLVLAPNSYIIYYK